MGQDDGRGRRPKPLSANLINTRTAGTTAAKYIATTVPAHRSTGQSAYLLLRAIAVGCVGPPRLASSFSRAVFRKRPPSREYGVQTRSKKYVSPYRVNSNNPVLGGWGRDAGSINAIAACAARPPDLSRIVS